MLKLLYQKVKTKTIQNMPSFACAVFVLFWFGLVFAVVYEGINQLIQDISSFVLAVISAKEIERFVRIHMNAL